MFGLQPGREPSLTQKQQQQLGVDKMAARCKVTKKCNFTTFVCYFRTLTMAMYKLPKKTSNLGFFKRFGTAVVAAECLALFGSYYVWRKLNRNQASWSFVS